jgi:hypothetical protein
MYHRDQNVEKSQKLVMCNSRSFLTLHMWDINNKNEVCSETIKESIQEILVPIQLRAYYHICFL